MRSISAKYELWTILLSGKYYFYFILLTSSNLNLTAGFYEHFNSFNFYYNESYDLKVVNNKSIMFKQLITVSISKFCVAGNWSDKTHSISAARLSYVICDKISKCDHSLNIIDNILSSKFWGIKAVFHLVNFCPWIILWQIN